MDSVKNNTEIYKSKIEMTQNVGVGVQSYIDMSKNTYLQEVRENKQKQNCMPFLFRSKRDFIDKSSTNNAPPVGSYNLKDCFSNSRVYDLNTETNMKKYQVLRQQLEKQTQMGIFKSNQERFKNKYNQVPGPTHYPSQSEKKIIQKSQINISKTRKNALLQKFSSLKRSGSNCPAIPNSYSKFGYSKTKDGKLQQVKKTQQILNIQKQKLRKYTQTLVGECRYQKKQPFRSNLHHSYTQNKQIKTLSEKFVNNLTYKQTRLRHNSSQSIVQKQSRSRQINKQRSVLKESRQIKNSAFIKSKNTNKFKLIHHVQIKKKYDQKLGPGCYDVKLNTLKLRPKQEQFQFFGSTQKRFKEINAESKENSNNQYEHIFTQIRDHNNLTKQNQKIFKKSVAALICPHQICKKPQLPGPGYYQSTQFQSKKNAGNIKFSLQERFKQKSAQRLETELALTQYLECQQKNEQKCKKTKGMWSSLKKQKIRGPQTQYVPVKEQEIYGIMNDLTYDCKKDRQQLQKIDLNHKNKQNSKGSAVFLDKSKRFNQIKIKQSQDSYSRNVQNQSTSQNKNMSTKQKVSGCYMSRLQKQNIMIQKDKAYIPGPGEYNAQPIGKKTFTIIKKK